MPRFHISATGHSLNYLPEYVAAWQGDFAAEGLAVTAAVASPWDRVLSDLDTGAAAAALGGIWVPAIMLGRGRPYTAFAQASLRAPLALVGRAPDPAFGWGRLRGRAVAVMGAVGVGAGLLLRMLLRENGVDPASVHLIPGLDGALLTRLFRGGLADYLLTDAVSAATLQDAGGGHVVADLAACGGNVPWSVYYAPGGPDDATSAELDARTRFCRALGRGMAFIQDRPAAEYGDRLGRLFPDADPALLIRLVDGFRAAGLWTTPRIDRPSHDRWQGALAADRLVAAPVPYDELVDARPSR